ncbi:ABC transporter ATP-binding protein [Citreicella sp. C3M06]|uniref:ABC transporter ATP-binding protein n=1 Tax=Citreicella sp. C3M06 TaxID=2841564 RepID=UPI002090B1D4|nr:ATP-binding cassette domain-containing protein [Citreicella sp. C3M06]
MDRPPLQAEIRAKGFGPVQVLRDIVFTVARGETVALVGPSGIGKSTVLRIVAGLDRDFDGSVRRPERIAMVFQEPTLLPWRSAAQNLTLIHPALTGRAANDMLARVGLAGRGDAFPRALSLGQQRRLALARAFAGAPELLIMDEPFVSLDQDLADQMLQLTQELIAEHRPATLFVTHARSEATRLGARVLELRGSPATLVPHLV